MSRVVRFFIAQSVPISVAAAAFILVVGLPVRDSDTYWHLATARWTVEHGVLLRHDVFSSTVAGQPYGVGEWLGELVLYASYVVGGWGGIAVLRALLVAGAAFFVTRVVRRSGAPLVVVLPLVIAVLAVSAPTWTDRPQLWTLLLMPLLLDLLLAARAGGLGWLVAVPPLFFVWTDLHGGFTLGLALVGAFTVEAVVRRRLRAWPFVLALVIAALATLANPSPFDAGTTAREDLLAPPRFITEFLPPDVLAPAGAIFAFLVLAAIGTALVVGGDVLDGLLLGPLLWLGLSAQRHTVFFAIVAAAFVARGLRRVRPRPGPTLPGWAGGAFAAVLCIAALAASFGAPGQPDERAYPAAALSLLRAGEGRLLNEYDWGGYLIWNLPERPVFVDGRYVPYLGGVLGDFRDAVGLAPDWRSVLRGYDVREALLRPSRPLAVALAEDGWSVVASTDRWIYLRRPR
jgi:hypothetical protein